MDINKIRNEVLTEDAKMEIIADLMDQSKKPIDVVEVKSMSGTLSDEDFAKISSNNCMMFSSTQYFYKQYSASTVIRYGALPRLGNDRVIFDYITIDKRTKAFELKNEFYPAV